MIKKLKAFIKTLTTKEQRYLYLMVVIGFMLGILVAELSKLG